MAEKMKAEKKQKAIAILRDCPTSPRKMRLVADIIRGVEINKAPVSYTHLDVYKRQEEMHRMAEANKAFAHFRF